MVVQKRSWTSAIVCFAVALFRVLSSVKAQCNSNGFILTGSNGSFSSPNYPSDYPNSETCRWIISAPQGHLVQLNFQTFVLETCLVPLICSCDHVEVRDGSDANSPKLGKFCGNNKPAPIQSSGRYMWVEFDSDLTRNEKGFYATYIAVAVPVPVTTSPAPSDPSTSPTTTPTVPETSQPGTRVAVTGSSLPVINVCSNPNHPPSCNHALTPICCYDSGPSCCHTGGTRCVDDVGTRDYCPRPSDDPSKDVCCLDDNGKPSCCDKRSYCYHWFGLDLSPASCIGATVGVLVGGGGIVVVLSCLCIFLCQKHPEYLCIPCIPFIMCWEWYDKLECDCCERHCSCCSEYCCKGCNWDCCKGCKCDCCKGCKCDCCDDCGCGNCDCGNCDCGGCDCGGCDCGGCDCGGCDCGGDCCVIM